MSRSAHHTRRQPFPTAPLLVLLVAALVLEGVPVVHAHLDGQPGVYNEACSLSLLASPTSAAFPALDLLDSCLTELPAAGGAAPSVFPSPFFLCSAPRAPPLL